ncbi:hypothetical protein CFP56_023372 [Quercus suber]|uniref:Uncharacterized protein n=1 Tax=Quercus suber TaxID=58331 RepID=A0AAW0K8N2_QUESU
MLQGIEEEKLGKKSEYDDVEDGNKSQRGIPVLLEAYTTLKSYGPMVIVYSFKVAGAQEGLQWFVRVAKWGYNCDLVYVYYKRKLASVLGWSHSQYVGSLAYVVEKPLSMSLRALAFRLFIPNIKRIMLGMGSHIGLLLSIDELGKHHGSSSFELGNNGEKPDLSWV